MEPKISTVRRERLAAPRTAGLTGLRMAEPFKNFIDPRTVARTGEHLARVWSRFERARFERLACAGLEQLELKARAMQIADALEQTLPADFRRACEILESSLSAPLPFDEAGEPVGLGAKEQASGLSGWAVWALGEFVARRGLDDVPRALACLHALTQRFSAEFALRPFLQRHPAATLRILILWTRDPSAHVRRLASEGSRPRLPWGLRLHAFVKDPAPTLPLLRALQDDPSSYVRRSVANHLNDIAKDHPALVADWVREHLADAGPARLSLLRHASRTLVKTGHPATLEAWGLGRPLRGDASLALTTSAVRIGDKLGLEVRLVSSHPEPQLLVIDYAVHYRRADGSLSRKVFKGWKLTLAAGETRRLAKQHSFRPVTTRRLHPGPHQIDLLVNGQVAADRGFTLRP